MRFLYILFTVILPSKFLAIDWSNFKINYSYGIIETLVILRHDYLDVSKKSITTHEIADIIETMFGCCYTLQTISNVTKVIM